MGPEVETASHSKLMILESIDVIGIAIMFILVVH